jgi:PAS domain S-box-containing protein
MTSILVVDDEPNLTWTMAEFLKRQGYDALTASDYDSAVEVLDAGKIDVAVVDIILSGKSGIELGKRISQSDRYIPVLLITGQPNLERFPEILRAGACDYLPKPVLKDDLIQAVSRAVDLKRAADEKQRTASEARNRVTRLQADLEERDAELSAAAEMLKAVLDRSNEYAIFAIDGRGTISLFNQTASELFKEAAEDALGRPVSHLFACYPSANQDFAGCVAPADGNGTRQGNADLRKADGTIFSASFTARPIRAGSGELSGYLVVVKDMASAAEAQDGADRQESSAADPEGIVALGRAAAQIAHEVKNPLTGLRLYSAHLRSKLTESPGSPQIQLVDKIIDTVNHLSEVVERTLDFARPARLNPVNSELRRVIEEALRLVETDLASKQVAVECDLPAEAAECVIDELYIRLALVNLVLNAIQAMSSGGRLGVRLSLEEHAFVLVIEDNGSGINIAQLGRIFEPFYSTKARGLGLGLPFTKNIIEGHQGTIAITSREGSGTRATVSLPRKDAST